MGSGASSRRFKGLEEIRASDLEVCLASSGLTSLPELYTKNPMLTRLDISANKLAVLPAHLFHLESLTMLDASCNHLREIPTSISELWRLRCLLVGDNDLTQLPSSIGSCTMLEKLGLENNNVREMPISIAQCTALLHISLDNNLISCLEAPFQLAGVVTLQSLLLNDNRLGIQSQYALGAKNLKLPTPLPTVHTNSGDTNLGATVVSSLQSASSMQFLPMVTEWCCQLLRLELRSNQLQRLPSLAHLTLLRVLDASVNELSEMPEMNECTALQQLLLRHNRFKTVPPELPPLDRLCLLDLRDNQIKDLVPPAHFERFSSLTQLRISGPRHSLKHPVQYQMHGTIVTVS